MRVCKTPTSKKETADRVWLTNDAESQSDSSNLQLAQLKNKKTGEYNQTSILGTNSLTINTGNNTDIIGAVIANSTNGQIGANAIDGGNLALNTGSLTYSNLYDHDYSRSSGFGISTSIGVAGGNNSSSAANNTTGQGTAPANNPNQQNNFYPNGSTTISANNFGYKKEQTTAATIGSGNITTGSTNDQAQLAGLNRNLNQTQEITKNTITGALNVTTTIDNRLIAAAMGSETAQSSLMSDQGNIGKNLLTATEAQNQLLLGVLPTPKTEGGLLGGLYAMAAGDQRNLEVSMSDETKLRIAQANKNHESFKVTTNENGERIVTFQDGSIATLTLNKTDLDDFNTNLKLELNQNKEGSLISSLKTNKDTSFNGIMNTENEAIRNGLMQMGALQSNTLNVNYDPTHGFAADFLEVAWNKMLGDTFLQTGNLNELNAYGQNVARAAKTYDITGLRMTGHSGDGERLVDGVLRGVDTGVFGYIDAFKQKQTRLQVQFYGTPISNDSIKTAFENATKTESASIKHQINPGDYVGENLGRGNSPNTADKLMGPFGPGLLINGYKLITDSSPHSNYFCQGDFCGYDKLNLNNSNQPRAP